MAADVKTIQVYSPTHKRLKLLCAESSKQLIDESDALINEALDARAKKKASK